MNLQQQKPADKVWKDEEGMEIPYNRTTAYERKAESEIFKLAKKAMAVHDQLTDFKAYIRRVSQELYTAFLVQNGGKIQGKGKGNITLYNFDRSIKLEVAVNEPIHFDEAYIKLAKELLDNFLTSAIQSSDDFIKELIMSAFERSRGELDTDKVLSLKKHASRIKDERYQRAMEFIDKAINRPTSKVYERVWVRDEHGQYQAIQLNFSSIK